MSTRGSPHAVGRRVMTLLAVVLFLAIDAPGAATVEAADLSGTIASVRRGQISAESSMRQADRQLKSLQRAQRVTRKRVRAATRRLERLEERRVAARQRADAASDRLALARLLLQQEDEPQTEPPTSLIGSALAIIAASADASLGAIEDEAAPRGVTALLADPEPLGSRTDTRAPPELRRLASEARRTRKVARQLGRKTRRAQRARAALVRSVPRIRQQTADTVGRREGAEAVLAGYIKSMSALAHKRVAKKTKPSNWSGFAWPIRGRISQGYHRGHDGVDLVASRGAPIRAMAIGVVAYVGWNPWDRGRRAFVVVVAHPKGYETVYGHLLPIRRVTVGHVVKKAQLIGHMGNTGHSTGVHLHIEVRRGFRTIDPLGVL